MKHELTTVIEWFVHAMNAEGMPEDSISKVVTTVVEQAMLDHKYGSLGPDGPV